MSVQSPSPPCQYGQLLALNKFYFLALRSEFFYDRLSLDNMLLSLSILAVDAAEIRDQLTTEIADSLIRAGGEVPATPVDLRHSLKSLRNAEHSAKLRLNLHLEACAEADRNLIKVIKNDSTLRRYIPMLKSTYQEILDYCEANQIDTQPIPHLSEVA